MKVPTWPEIETRHATIDDKSYDCYQFVVDCSSEVRFADKGIYYLVLHRERYNLHVPYGTNEHEIADKLLNAQKDCMQRFIRNVEVSKMNYVIDPTHHDGEGRQLNMPDPDQTPENERLQNLYLP